MDVCFPGKISFKFEWFGREVALEDRRFLAQKKGPAAVQRGRAFCNSGLEGESS